MNFYEIARTYRKFGINVGSLCNYSKSPDSAISYYPEFINDMGTKVRGWKPLQERMSTDEEFDFMFKDRNDLTGIGAFTGKTSNLDAVDEDSYKEGGFRFHLDSPAKYQTASGGMRYLFGHNPEIHNIASKKGVYVEVMTTGRFIVLPPSKVKLDNGIIGGYMWINPLDTINFDNLPILTPEDLLRYEPSIGSKVNLLDLVHAPVGARHDSLRSIALAVLNRFSPKEWEQLAYPFIRQQAAEFQEPHDPKDVERLIEDCSEFVLNNPKETTGVSKYVHLSSFQAEWPEPPSESAYYGLAGEIIKAIEPQSEADPIALLMNFLTSFGSVIGDHSYNTVEADRHTCRLFCVLVGDSSKARKGVSWGQIRKLFETVDQNWQAAIQTGLSSGEGLIWAVRDKITKQQPRREQKRIVGYEEIIEDPGITDKRLLVVEPEFASTLRILGREGSTLSPIIRNAWDTGKLQSLTKNSPARATGAHVSILGHITREELQRYLTETEMGNGFGNRLLFICVKRSKSLPFGGNLSGINFQTLVKKLADVTNFAKEQGELTWSDEAGTIWREIYPELSEGKPGLIGALTARAEAQVLRLAMIYALLDLSEVIRPPHLYAALAIWQYAEDSVRYIFHFRSGNTLADNIYSLLKRNPDGFTKTAIINNFSRHISAQDLSDALALLENLDQARSKTELTEGRPAEVWFAIPQEMREKRIKRIINHSINEQTNLSSLNSHNSQLILDQSFPQTQDQPTRMETPETLANVPAPCVSSQDAIDMLSGSVAAVAVSESRGGEENEKAKPK